LQGLYIYYTPFKKLSYFKMSKAEWENNEEIKIFRDYLRIKTEHPNIDYSKFIDCNHYGFLDRD